MKVSASIYAQQQFSLTELAHQLKQLYVDYLHIDSIDNIAVFDDIKILKQQSTLALDAHFITKNWEPYISLINEHKIDAVAFQYEEINKVVDWKTLIPNSKVGIAILNTTPLKVIEQHLHCIDYVLLMTTTPGLSGGKFSKETFARIRKVKSQFPQLAIRVDGGVNAEVSFILRNMGVDTAIVGSYLFKQSSIAEALINLRLQHTHSSYLVDDIKIECDELPIISNLKIPLIDVLQCIEKYQFGFLLATDENGSFKGLISNADVRKAILKKKTNLELLTASDLINTNPLLISSDKTIDELLMLIKQNHFPIMYLPVVNSQGKLSGALTFNNLIKGE